MTSREQEIAEEQLARFIDQAIARIRDEAATVPLTDANITILATMGSTIASLEALRKMLAAQ